MTTSLREDREQQRARRDRSARISALSSLAARGISMAVSFFSVPLMARHLDPERYGFFLTASTMAAWLTVADVGLGHGLTNRIAEAEANGDRQLAATLFRSAVWTVGTIGVGLLLLLGGALFVAPMRDVFGVSDNVPATEVRWTLGVLFFTVVASIPLGLVEKTYAGYQQIYINNIWTAIAAFSSLIGLIAAILLGSGLPVIVAVTSGPLMLCRAVSGVFLVRGRPWLRPWPIGVDRQAARGLLTLGGGFLLAQLAAIGLWQTDQIVLSQLFGAAAVAPYVVTLRVGTLYVGLLLTWLSPMWPACTDAAARGDWDWVENRLKHARRIAMSLTIVVAIGLCLVGRQLISLWAGAAIAPTLGLLVAMAVYLVILVWCHVHGVILNALGRARGQALYGLAATIINIGASIVLGRWLGVAGVCVGTCVAALPVAALVFLELRWALRQRAVQ